MARRPNPTVTPYTRADGTTTYRVRVRVRGQQTTETFESAAAAEVFRLRCIDPSVGPARAVDMRSREDRRHADYVPTIRELLEIHLAGLSGVEPRTVRDYRATAERTWLRAFASLRVDELEREDVTHWVRSETGTLAPKSIANAHGILSSVLNTAVFKGYVEVNVARGTRLPRAGEESRTENRYLTPAEFNRLLEATSEHYRPFVVTLFGTGLRFSEATALQVQDVNLEQRTMRVVRAWKDRGSRAKIGPPKSVAGRRTISLPVEVCDILEPLVEGRKGSDWLFTTRGGGVVRHNNFYNRVWRGACKRAGLDPHPRPHDARHTHASWLLAAGVRLEVVQDRLGHEDYRTTRKVYGHLMPDMIAEAGRAASVAFANTSIRAIGSGG